MNKHKWISVAIIFMVAGIILAAQNFKVGYSGPQGQGDIIYTKASDGSTQLRLGTTSALAVDTMSAVSRKVLVTEDNTTQYAMEVGTSTQGVVIAFTTVFSAAPKIVCTYQEDSGADTAIEIQSKNTTNFTITATAAKNIDWIAVGEK